MANKAKKNNKNLIIGICVAAIVVIAIVVAVVLITRGAAGPNQLGDSYFVSDGSKYVLTLETEEDEEYAPIKSHMIYFYSGDEITGMKIYYEYADESAAKAALDYYKDNFSESDYKDISVEGKYLVFTSNESDYEGLTASDVKQQIEFMEMLKNMNFDEETVIEEPTADADEVVEIDTVEGEE